MTQNSAVLSFNNIISNCKATEIPMGLNHRTKSQIKNIILVKYLKLKLYESKSVK